jgi:hypothetical protein
MEKRDEIPQEVLARLPEGYRKKFEKIRLLLHEAGVRPSNIKNVLSELEKERQRLKGTMTDDRWFMEQMEEKAKHRTLRRNSMEFTREHLRESERKLFDLNEKIQTLRAIDGHMAKRKIGVTVDDIKRFKEMDEWVKKSRTISPGTMKKRAKR